VTTEPASVTADYGSGTPVEHDTAIRRLCQIVSTEFGRENHECRRAAG